MEQYREQKGKKIVPRGDPILHGNHARIDPKKSLMSEYQFNSATAGDRHETDANLPISSWQSVQQAKHDVDENKK